MPEYIPNFNTTTLLFKGMQKSEETQDVLTTALNISFTWQFKRKT